MDPIVAGAVHEVFSILGTTDTILRRGEIRNTLYERLKPSLEENFIVLDDVSIASDGLPVKYKAAIVEKHKVTQQIERFFYDRKFAMEGAEKALQMGIAEAHKINEEAKDQANAKKTEGEKKAAAIKAKADATVEGYK